MSRRVAITGIGTINPLGKNPEEYYKNLIAGVSGITQWTSSDLSSLECRIGGDMGDFDFASASRELCEILPPETRKLFRKMMRTSTFAAKMGVLTAMQAFRDSGIPETGFPAYKTSVNVAGHNFNSNYIFENFKRFTDDIDDIDPLSGVEAIDPNIPALITEILGIHGPAMHVGGACASGNLALRLGFRDIVSGECDFSVVTGPPFDVAPPDIHASVILNAVVINPEYQNNPTEASRPFDKDRCGFLYSHGSATLLLEEYESAVKRNAPIYGELLGVTASANANHLPMPGAGEQVKVIRRLLEQTGVSPEEIDYVNCHATGTPSGDFQEARAVMEVFGENPAHLYVNAPKSMLGHTCWASPLVETVGGLLQMKHGMLHPTINIKEQDPRIKLNICPNKPVEHRIRYMLKNSFGFGGVNCCSLIKKVDT